MISLPALVPCTGMSRVLDSGHAPTRRPSEGTAGVAAAQRLAFVGLRDMAGVLDSGLVPNGEVSLRERVAVR